MFEQNLDFEFHLGIGELKLLTNYDESVSIHNYYLEKTEEHKEFFSVYSTGLVIYVNQLPGEITMKSNMNFEMNDNQDFVLING